MNRVFKTILLALTIIPCVFIFSACQLFGGGDDSKDTGKRDSVKVGDGNTLATAMESVGNVGDNYTIKATLTASGVFASMFGNGSETNGTSQNEIIIEQQNLDSYIVTNSSNNNFSKNIIVGNESYYFDNQTNKYYKRLSYYDSFKSVSQYLDIVEKAIKNNDLLDYIKTYKPDQKICNIKYKTENNETTVIVTIDYKDEVAKVINALKKTYKQNVSNFINELMGSETSYDDLVNSIKTTITENTTFKDLFNFINEKTGLQLEKIAKLIYENLQSHKEIRNESASFYTYNGSLAFFTNKNIANDTFENYLNKNIYVELGINYNSVSNVVNLALAYLNSTTVEQILNQYVLKNTGYNVESLLSIEIEKIQQDYEFVISSDKTIKSVKIGANFEGTLKNNGVTVNLQGTILSNISFSKIGTTTVAKPSANEIAGDETNIITLNLDKKDLVSGQNKSISLDSSQRIYVDEVKPLESTGTSGQIYVQYNTISHKLELNSQVVDFILQNDIDIMVILVNTTTFDDLNDEQINESFYFIVNLK